MWRAVLRVSSMRVPRCSSALMLIRPLSCSFMKSIPILPVRNGSTDRMKNASAMNNVMRLWPRHHLKTLAYQASIALKTRPIVLSKVSFFAFFLRSSSSRASRERKKGFSLSILLESIGMRVMAAVVDTHTTMVTIQPSSFMNIPIMPGNMVRGTNTATRTRVVAMTEVQTSLVAQMAASRGDSPRSICLVMFSNTTMASSTTIPMATVSEASDMMLSDESASSR